MGRKCISQVVGAVMLAVSPWFVASAAPVCRCADTGVCILPAGECNSVGKPLVAPLARKIALRHKVIRQDAWYGGRRTVFDFNGYEAWVVEPPEGVTPPKGRPWTWTMQWRTAFVPRTSVPELLKRGFHHVTIDTFVRRMDAEGLKVSKAFQDYLVDELGFAPKAKLIGLSWGGFFSVRYAAAYPESVERIALDNPLLDFGAKFTEDIGSWAERRPATGDWTGHPEMPLSKAEILAKTDIPILLCYGSADTVTPPAQNALAFDECVRKAGGRIRTIVRPGGGHHPHGVEPGDTTLVDFMTEDIDPEPEVVTRRISLLENGDLSEYWYTWLQGSRMRGVDRLGVFTAEDSTLKVNGADMGCVTTKRAFRDYRLTLEFRYADTDVQLNKKAARDGGLLFHSTGADGVYGPGVWMPSFEYNIIQGATADLIVIGDGERHPGHYRVSGCVDEAWLKKGLCRWSPQGKEVRHVDKGRIDSPESPSEYLNTCAQPVGASERPVGEWNTSTIVCHGDEVEFYLNGTLVGHYYDLQPSGGRIQLQSEGFGIEYRNIVLEPLTADEAAGKDVPQRECRLRAGASEIVIAPGAHAAEKLAASEMAELLGQALGAPVPVVRAPTPGKTSVFLGSNEWTRAAGIRTESLSRDAFSIVCDGKAVFIAGRDDATDDPSGHCFLGNECRWQLQFERGTLFGVYEFLERYANVRMYFPGELGTVVPETEAVGVPRLQDTVTPDYTVRRWGYDDGRVPKALLGEGKTENDFKLRHFYRLRGETAYIPCCHGQRKFGYERRFPKSHPEYFVMAKDGERVVAGLDDPLHGGQLCQSSGIWDEMYLDIASYLKGEPASVRGVLDEDGKSAWGRCVFGNVIDVMPQDGMATCYCPKCQAAYRQGDIDYATELVWGQTARLGERLKADGLDCTLVLEAYLPYGRIPEVELPDNVNVQVSRAGPWSVCTPSTRCRHDAEIAAWTKKLGHRVWLWTYTDKVECFNVGMPDVPQMTPRTWGEYYKSLRDSIVGAFSESESDRWFYNYLNYYIFSKVCWDTKADVDALLDEHYRLMYGAGAPFVRRFFESLEHKWIYEIEVDMRDSSIGPAVASAPSQKDVWTKVYSPDVLARYSAWLDAAAAAVLPGSLEARRIALVRDEMLVPMLRHAHEPAYGFRNRLETVHEPGRRDTLAEPRVDEFAFRDGCRVPTEDLADYLRTSMDVRATVDAEKGVVSVVLDRSLREREYTVDVSASGVAIRAYDERARDQALYHLEDLMNLRRAPFLSFGHERRRMRYSPRMTHSGWGLDKFPDAHLRQLAHQGFDAILLFLTGVDETQGGGKSAGINDIIDRALRLGLDTYLYSKVPVFAHPDDPEGARKLRETFGAIAAAHPKAKGIVFVGESAEFPSRDERTCGLSLYQERPKGETRPLPGWYPCRDYPDWLKAVQAALREKSPGLEIVFWTYNWSDCPPEQGAELLKRFPPDVAIESTFAPGEGHRYRNGLEVVAKDYTLSIPGPNRHFEVEAQAVAAGRRKLYAMSNTGGLTWDHGVVPYQPNPYQWKKRLDALKATDGLVGLMESHHYGCWPSFVTELVKESFTEGGLPFDDHIRKIAVRDFGEGDADEVLSVWKVWSEAAADYVATNENQYGPFRLGPAYPFNFGGTPIGEGEFPQGEGATHVMRWMAYLNYPYDKVAADSLNITYESILPADREKDLELLRSMQEKWMEGTDRLRKIARKLCNERRRNAERMADLGEWHARTVATAIALRRGQAAFAAGDRKALVAVAAEERQNAVAALELAERDSRLGWEPSMEYVGGPEQIRWKIALIDRLYGREFTAGEKSK